MLYDLHVEFQFLMDKLSPLIKYDDPVSWQRKIADLVMPLCFFLCEDEKDGKLDTRSKRPFIFSAISEDDKIFHPFRKSKFQLIHSDRVSVSTDKNEPGLQLAIFTIPMLYSPAKLSTRPPQINKELRRIPDFLTQSDLIPLPVPIHRDSIKNANIIINSKNFDMSLENPFDMKSHKKLTLKEWLDLPVLRVNTYSYTIMEILKEIRNKKTGHRGKMEKLEKKSFLQQTRFLNFNEPYWSYFIFFCALYIASIIKQLLEDKGIETGRRISIVPESKIDITMEAPMFLTTGGFITDCGRDSFLVLSDDVEFIANKEMDKEFVWTPFMRIKLESKFGIQAYDIPLMMIDKMARMETDPVKNENTLYFHFRGKKCGYGLDFKPDADCGLMFTKRGTNVVGFKCDRFVDKDNPIIINMRFFGDSKPTAGETRQEKPEVHR